MGGENNPLNKYNTFMMFHMRCQDLAPQFPDIRHPTPKTYKLRHSCPAGATYSERNLGLSLAPLWLIFVSCPV